ncbi:MAG: winged helix-turn-helix domain-containing protein [Pseudomonadota bacterium]
MHGTASRHDPDSRAATARMAHPQGRRPLIKRGALTATFDPLEICWNGQRVPLSPLEAEILAHLIKRERAAWSDLRQLLIDHAARPDTCEVLVFRIRRKFAALGATNPIETLRGWGLRLRVERDARGSRSLWIGATEVMDWSAG